MQMWHDNETDRDFLHSGAEQTVATIIVCAQCEVALRKS
jgi:hypothetical protein